VAKQNVAHNSEPEEKDEEDNSEVDQVFARFVHSVHKDAELWKRSQKLEDQKGGNQ
jgi:hypothetical protein